GQPRRIPGNPIDVRAYRYLDGAASLTTRMADRLPRSTVHLGRAAVAVNASSTGLRISTAATGRQVDTAGQELRAQHVILAMAPALAAARISFTPALPPPLVRLGRTTPVWMAGVTKIVACYAEPFWREQGLAGAAVSTMGPLREVHDMSGPNGN